MSDRIIKKARDTKLRYLWIAVGLMVLPCAGCSTAVIEGSASAVSRQDGQTVVKNQIRTDNDRMEDRLQITDLKADFAGNLLRAHVSLLNKNNNTGNFQFKFSWFDENGNEIDSDTDAWTPLILYGNESRSLQAIAPAPSVKEFKIKIRELSME